MMNKKMWIVVVVCLGWSIAARADDALPPKTHPDSSSWQDLFAHDLSNAIYPKGVWYFEDDVLTATEDQNIWTKESMATRSSTWSSRTRPGRTAACSSTAAI